MGKPIGGKTHLQGKPIVSKRNRMGSGLFMAHWDVSNFLEKGTAKGTSFGGPLKKTPILWMDEILLPGRPLFLVFYRKIIIYGFLRWCRISSIHSRWGEHKGETWHGFEMATWLRSMSTQDQSLAWEGPPPPKIRRFMNPGSTLPCMHVLLFGFGVGVRRHCPEQGFIVYPKS